MTPDRGTVWFESPVRQPIYATEGVEFAPPKFAPFSRLCWWFLNKRKALKPRRVCYSVLKFTPAEAKRIDEALKEHIYRMREHLDLEPEKWAIILGGAEFRELTDITLSHPFMFALGDIRDVRNRYRHSFMGLPVHVVPGMTGAAVIPRIAVERTDG